MKDIDFDELDRAVSSVLGQDKPVETEAPVEKAVAEKAPKKTENVQTTETEPVASANKITLNPRPKTTGPRSTGPSLATTRRGKFMDVMHQPVQTQTSSQKPTIEPVVEPAQKRGMLKLEPSKELQEDSKESNQDVSEDTVKPVEMVSAVEHVAEPTATVDESHALIGAEPASVDAQLLDAASIDDETSIEKEEVEEKEDKPAEKAPSHKLEDDLAALSIDDTPAPGSSLSSSALTSSMPQESPFLADTKVEKRPLGGSPEVNESEDELAGYGVDTYQKKDVQSAPVVPIPRELEADIVSVEAAQNEQEQTVTSSPFTAHVAASAEPRDDGRVDGHPLFDTSTYHEPIAAVHHAGMPGWVKWLIGLILCLAMGAGVGYFLFTAGL